MSRLPARGEDRMWGGRAATGPARQRLRRIVSIEKSVSDHYTHGSLAAAILRGLEEAAGHADDITSADLAPVDEFHIGGRAAAVHLIDQLGFASGMSILGRRFRPGRYGALCGGKPRVPGHGHRSHSGVLRRRSDVGRKSRSCRTRFPTAKAAALDMPFAEEAFDGVYTIHVAMNIADKPKLYREVHRVVRPGATFGIYDILEGPAASNLAFPVPWAATPETSFLTSIDRLGRDARGSGFLTSRAGPTAGVSLWISSPNSSKGRPTGLRPLGLHILMGEDFSGQGRQHAAQCQRGALHAVGDRLPQEMSLHPPGVGPHVSSPR